MPRKNVRKPYLEDSFYHVYNRSPKNRLLFPQEKDYLVYKRYFYQLLKQYEGDLRVFIATPLPNHYHFLLWQKNPETMTVFMRRLSCRYNAYYRVKYDHRGSLYESAYKARLLRGEEDIYYVFRYIRKNPIEAGYPNWPHIWGEGLDSLATFLKEV